MGRRILSFKQRAALLMPLGSFLLACGGLGGNLNKDVKDALDPTASELAARFSDAGLCDADNPQRAWCPVALIGRTPLEPLPQERQACLGLSVAIPSGHTVESAVWDNVEPLAKTPDLGLADGSTPGFAC